MSLSSVRTAAIVVALLITTIGAAFLYRGTHSEPAPTVTRTISYTLRIRNLSNRVITPLTIETFVPIERTGWQRVAHLEASVPLATRPPADVDLGRASVAAEFLLPPYGVHVLQVTSRVALWNAPYLRTEPVADGDLAPGAYIESTAEPIVELARSLRRESPLETARAIHTWINANITGESYVEEPRSAAFALEQRRGDCTEFSHLFVALARANGIPARAIAGFVVERDKHLRAVDYHNWAEFHDGAVWRLADPNLNNFDRQYEAYVAFRALNGTTPAEYQRSAERFTVRGGAEVELALQ